MRNSIKYKSRWEKITAVSTERLWIENLERDSENTKRGQTNKFHEKQQSVFKSCPLIIYYLHYHNMPLHYLGMQTIVEFPTSATGKK